MNIRTLLKAIIPMLSLAAGATLASAATSPGEAAFKAHCAACHANGGNIVNPARTLFPAARKQEGIKNAKDIVRFMRSPGPGMPVFNTSLIPDKTAHEIAEYIIKTFK